MHMKLEGFNGLDRLLKDLPNKVEKRILQTSVNAALRVGVREIKKNTPRGLKPSQASRKYKSLHKNIRVIRLKRHKANARAARITTGDAYWGYIYEKGSRYQEAKPFFEPAFKRSRDRMIKELGDRIGAGIKKEAKKRKYFRR